MEYVMGMLRCQSFLRILKTRLRQVLRTCKALMNHSMSRAMKGSYEEIGRMAGVSLATVYRVMNRRGQANVSTATEERVREAAGKLGIDRRTNPKSKLLAFLMGNRNVLHPF